MLMASRLLYLPDVLVSNIKLAQLPPAHVSVMSHYCERMQFVEETSRHPSTILLKLPGRL